MRARNVVFAICLQASACSISTPASASSSDFNAYILKAVDKLNSEYGKEGYDINSAFTHDLLYPDDDHFVKATNPPLTMCVAAVEEVIVTAIKTYADQTGDNSVYTKIPLKAWTQGNLLSLRANIFMYGGTGSKGTGYTLSSFQLGDELRFPDLKPGDFVNLNRSKTGHAVVFLGYVNKDLSLTNEYSDEVVGFKYFSSQGKGSGSGFGYRYGYFNGFCPNNSPEKRDCGIIRSNNPSLLNVGRMWGPDRWNYLGAVSQKRVSQRNIVADENPNVRGSPLDALVDEILQRPLKMLKEQEEMFDGETTD